MRVAGIVLRAFLAGCSRAPHTEKAPRVGVTPVPAGELDANLYQNVPFMQFQSTPPAQGATWGRFQTCRVCCRSQDIRPQSPPLQLTCMYPAYNAQLTGARVQWPESAALAAKTGFPGCDVAIMTATKAGLDTTRDTLAKYRLRAVDETFQNGLKLLPDVASFAAAIDCPRMVTYILSSSDKPKPEQRAPGVRSGHAHHARGGRCLMTPLRSHVGSGLLPCRRASNPLYGVRAFCPARSGDRFMGAQ
jgi:hypothetical protein